MPLVLVGMGSICNRPREETDLSNGIAQSVSKGRRLKVWTDALVLLDRHHECFWFVVAGRKRASGRNSGREEGS